MTKFRKPGKPQSAEEFIAGAQAASTPAVAEEVKEEANVATSPAGSATKEAKPRRIRKKREKFASHTLPLTEEEYKRLEYCAEAYGQCHSGILRYGLIMLEKMAKGEKV